MDKRQLAAKYRADNARDDYMKTGYVVIYHGEVAGWTHSISDTPGGWVPGCVAVPADAAAPLYVATGGDHQKGAERWEPLVGNC